MELHLLRCMGQQWPFLRSGPARHGSSWGNPDHALLDERDQLREREEDAREQAELDAMGLLHSAVRA
jgi:hypothetical protein